MIAFDSPTGTPFVLSSTTWDGSFKMTKHNRISAIIKEPVVPMVYRLMITLHCTPDTDVMTTPDAADIGVSGKTEFFRLVSRSGSPNATLRPMRRSPQTGIHINIARYI